MITADDARKFRYNETNNQIYEQTTTLLRNNNWTEDKRAASCCWLLTCGESAASSRSLQFKVLACSHVGVKLETHLSGKECDLSDYWLKLLLHWISPLLDLLDFWPISLRCLDAGKDNIYCSMFTGVNTCFYWIVFS